MWKTVRPFKIRRFEVGTTFDDVELSAVCRIVGYTMTITITKPFNGVVTQIHALYSKVNGMWINKAKDLAKDELELTYMDFLTIAKDFETYKDVVYKQRLYLLELERKRRALMATLETVKYQYMTDMIDANEERQSYKSVNIALGMLEHDAKQHYKQMLRKHKLTEVSFEYAKQIVLWMIHNESTASELIKANDKQQAVLRAWMDSGTDESWEEWLNRQRKHEDN